MKTSASSLTHHICAYLPTYSHYQKTHQNLTDVRIPFSKKEKNNFHSNSSIRQPWTSRPSSSESQGSVLKEDSMHRVTLQGTATSLAQLSTVCLARSACRAPAAASKQQPLSASFLLLKKNPTIFQLLYNPNNLHLWNQYKSNKEFMYCAHTYMQSPTYTKFIHIPG